MIGIVDFVVIILANTLGAISGMGGGVLIKSIFEFIGAHSVSTGCRLSSGRKLNWRILGGVSVGSIVGDVLGSTLFEIFLVRV